MESRGLLLGLFGLVCLLFPEFLGKLLQKSEQNEIVQRRLNGALGVLLIVIGLFLALVDN